MDRCDQFKLKRALVGPKYLEKHKYRYEKNILKM